MAQAGKTRKEVQKILIVPITSRSYAAGADVLSGVMKKRLSLH